MHGSMHSICGQRSKLNASIRKHPAAWQLPHRRLLHQTRHAMPRPALITGTPVQPSSSSTGNSSSSSTGTPTDLTAIAADALTHGNGLARKVLADPGIEGDPLAFLKATEAYWKEMRNRKHEPHKKGPAVITSSNEPVAALLPQHSHQMHHSPSFGAAPLPAGRQSTASAQPAAAGAAGDTSSSSMQHDFDVVMCGGTLGIVVALALQQQGYRVAVVEKRRVEGRTQEWNSSRHECQVLVDLGLLQQLELEAAIVSEFNPVRVGFKGGEPLWVNDCLNIGINPKALIHSLRVKFESLGGVVYEQTAFKSAVVCPDGLVVSLAAAADAPVGVGDTNRPNALAKQQQQPPMHVPLVARDARLLGSNPMGNGRGSSNGSDSSSSSSSNGRHSDSTGHSNGNGHTAAAAAARSRVPAGRQAPSKLSCRLLLDCMGHYSPIVKQLRGRSKPDGMVLVVGGCATGFPAELNSSADLLTTVTDASADMQLFWEAFPAEGGAARTTYMFAYSDAQPSRPTFEKLLDAYFALLPAYQGLPSGLQGLSFKRVLFGGFPCYSDAPLKPGFDRVLQLGDASASQSPLSFGGFGSMLRHLPRLSNGISNALRDDRLSRADLAWIHPYQPSLSAAMLFQRSMSIGVGQLQQQQAQQQQQQQPIQQVKEQQEIHAALPAAAGPCNSTNGVSSISTGSRDGSSNNVVPAAGLLHISSSSGNGGGSHGVNGRTASHTNGTSRTTSNQSSSRATTSSPPEQTAVSSRAAAEYKSSSSSRAADTHTANNSSSSSSQGKPNWLQKLLLLPASHVNALLGANFRVMLLLGQAVLKPFLQDTLQLGPLAATMAGMMLVKPLVISRVLLQVGAKVLLGWFVHFTMLAAYSLGHLLLSPLRRHTRSYTFHRLCDALQYGSGSDYHYKPSPAVDKQQAAELNATLAAAVAAGTAAAVQEAASAGSTEQQQQQWRQRVKVQSIVHGGGWQSPEVVSHLGQQLRYVVAAGSATASQEEEALAGAHPAAAAAGVVAAAAGATA